jgi:hypothetical protein
MAWGWSRGFKLRCAASNKYFDTSSQPPIHPRIKAWKAYRKQPGVERVGVEVKRDRDGLNLLPARLFVSFFGKNDELVRLDEAPWEPELDNWLIDEDKARAVSVENEKLRFSLLLKPEMRPIVARYGDGYFNAVLMAVLQDGPFSTHPEVAGVIPYIHEGQPAGGSKQDCQELIEHVFSVFAGRLLALYGGDRDTAEDILGGAIARYLDDRFSVTNSKILGLV